jgi:hypothetical protein
MKNSTQPSKEKTSSKAKGIFYKFLFSLFGLENDEDKNEEEMKRELFDFLKIDYIENESEEESKKRIVEIIIIRPEPKTRKGISDIMKAAYELTFNEDLSQEERQGLLEDMGIRKDSFAGKAINFFESLDSRAKPNERDALIPNLSDFAALAQPRATDKRWYEDGDMQKGLEKNNQDKKNVHVFGAVPAQYSDLLENSIKTAKGFAERGQTALIPLNLNDNHWVGGAMTKIGNDLCFIHNDPMGSEINKALKNELTAQGVSIIDLKQRQQKDGDTYNCGPFTVDNLGKFAEAAKNGNDLGLTKDEFAENLKIGFESGLEAGQELRKSQSQDDSHVENLGRNTSSPFKGSFVEMLEMQRNGASKSGGGGLANY